MTPDFAALVVERLPADRSLRGPGAPWFIYGAGGRGREARRLLEAAGGTVAGYIDREAQPDRQVEGLPCLCTGELQPDQLRGHRVLLALYNYLAPLAPVYAVLEGADAERIVSFYEFHAAYG